MPETTVDRAATRGGCRRPGRIFVEGTRDCRTATPGERAGDAAASSRRRLPHGRSRPVRRRRPARADWPRLDARQRGRPQGRSVRSRANAARASRHCRRARARRCRATYAAQQVVAFVVRRDAALTTLAIRRRCATALSPHKIPRRFVFLDRLPVDARGKIDRRALEALADGAR